jgi:hypothetical protein
MTTVHICPKCNGNLIVLTPLAQHDFDGCVLANLPVKEECRVCKGKGYIVVCT